LGALFPGSDWVPVYAKKWIEPGTNAHMVLFLSLSGKHPCIEIFHARVARLCAELGAVAGGQDRMNNGYERVKQEQKRKEIK